MKPVANNFTMFDMLAALRAGQSIPQIMKQRQAVGSEPVSAQNFPEPLSTFQDHFTEEQLQLPLPKAPRSFDLPHNWQKKIEIKKQQPREDEKISLKVNNNLSLLQGILESPHFTPAQKYLFWQWIESPDIDLSQINLIQILFEARMIPQNRLWIDSILQSQPEAREVASIHTRELPQTPGPYLLDSKEAKKLYQDIVNFIRPSYITPNPVPTEEDWMALVLEIGNFCYRYLSAYELHFINEVPDSYDSRIIETFFMIMDEVLKCTRTLPDDWNNSITLKRIITGRQHSYNLHFSKAPYLARHINEKLGIDIPNHLSFISFIESSPDTFFFYNSPNAIGSALKYFDSHFESESNAEEFITRTIKTFISSEKAPTIYTLDLLHNVFKRHPHLKQYFFEYADASLSHSFLIQSIFFPENRLSILSLIENPQKFFSELKKVSSPDAQYRFLESLGLFPGFQDLAEQPFGAMLLMKRLRSQNNSYLSNHLKPYSNYQQLTLDVEPQFQRIAYIFSRSLLFGLTFRNDLYDKFIDNIKKIDGTTDAHLITNNIEQPQILAKNRYDFTAYALGEPMPIIYESLSDDFLGFHSINPAKFFYFSFLQDAKPDDKIVKTKWFTTDGLDFEHEHPSILINSVKLDTNIDKSGKTRNRYMYFDLPEFLKENPSAPIVFDTINESHSIFKDDFFMQCWIQEIETELKKNKDIKSRSVDLINLIYHVVAKHFYTTDLENDIELQMLFENLSQGKITPHEMTMKYWQLIHDTRRLENGFFACGSKNEFSFVVGEILKNAGFSIVYAKGAYFLSPYHGGKFKSIIPLVLCTVQIGKTEREQIFVFPIENLNYATPDALLWYQKNLKKNYIDYEYSNPHLKEFFKREDSSDNSTNTSLKPVNNSTSSTKSRIQRLDELIETIFTSRGLVAPHAMAASLNGFFGTDFFGGFFSKPYYFFAPFLGPRPGFVFQHINIDYEGDIKIPQNDHESMIEDIGKTSKRFHIIENPAKQQEQMDARLMFPQQGRLIQDASSKHLAVYALPYSFGRPLVSNQSIEITTDKMKALYLHPEVPQEFFKDFDSFRDQHWQLDDIEAVTLFLKERYIYQQDPGKDEQQVDFVKKWNTRNPEKLKEYWQHIHSSDRMIHGKHPIQCLDIAFVAVNILRHLNIPSVYGDCNMLKGELYTITGLYGYLSDAHYHPLIIAKDKHGKDRLFPLQYTTEFFANADQKKNKTNKTSPLNKIKQTALRGLKALSMTAMMISAKINEKIEYLKNKITDFKESIITKVKSWFSWTGKNPDQISESDMKRISFSEFHQETIEKNTHELPHSRYKIPLNLKPQSLKYLIKILYHKIIVPENSPLEKPSGEFNLLEWLDWTLLELMPSQIIVDYHVSREIWEKVEKKQIKTYREQISHLYLQLLKENDLPPEVSSTLEDILNQALNRDDPEVIFESFPGEHKNKSRYHKFRS